MTEGMISMTNRFELWNEPPCPSETAMKVIRELHRLGREVYNIEGPAHEFRVSRVWLDIAYLLEGLKIAYEIDGPDHYTQKQMEYDKKRDAYLKSEGWIVIRISYKRIDKEGPEVVAEWIIQDLLNRKNSKDAS